MKIALIGYGKMGKLIEQLAKENGDSIVAIITRRDQYSSKKSAFLTADVCIDFSHPSMLQENVQFCKELKKPIVIGTTGCEDQMINIQKEIKDSTIGCFYSPNFSIGINLFMQMLNQALKLIEGFYEYDVAGIEYHHNKKTDRPSGTAIALTNQIKQTINNEHFTFESVRCGHIPGTHTILFDSPVDTITLTHTARNREGFAQGALKAAKWLIGKQGFYTMQDLIKENILCK